MVSYLVIIDFIKIETFMLKFFPISSQQCQKSDSISLIYFDLLNFSTDKFIEVIQTIYTHFIKPLIIFLIT